MNAVEFEEAKVIWENLLEARKHEIHPSYWHLIIWHRNGSGVFEKSVTQKPNEAFCSSCNYQLSDLCKTCKKGDCWEGGMIQRECTPKDKCRECENDECEAIECSFSQEYQTLKGARIGLGIWCKNKKVKLREKKEDPNFFYTKGYYGQIRNMPAEFEWY